MLLQHQPGDAAARRHCDGALRREEALHGLDWCGGESNREVCTWSIEPGLSGIALSEPTFGDE